MACTNTITLKAITTSCGSNVPSIKKLWVGKFGSATFTPNYVAGETDDDGKQIIENVKIATLVSGANKWVEFEFKKNTATADTEMTVNDNGSYYYNNTVTLVFNKQTNDKRLAVQALASGDCSVIYLDGNNNYWLMGYDAEVSNTATTATTGTAATDNNQYTITLGENSGTMPLGMVAGSSSSTVEDDIKSILMPTA